MQCMSLQLFGRRARTCVCVSMWLGAYACDDDVDDDDDDSPKFVCLRHLNTLDQDGSSKASVLEAQRAAMKKFLQKALQLDVHSYFMRPVPRAAFGDPAQAEAYFSTVKEPMSFAEVGRLVG